jgi:hypothetical protein
MTINKREQSLAVGVSSQKFYLIDEPPDTAIAERSINLFQ